MNEERRFARLGSGILMLAVLVMVVGAAIPFFAPSLREAPWTDDPQRAVIAIAGNPSAYAWANGLFMAAAIVTTLGLAGVSFGFRGRSRPWAVMGLVTFAFAALFSAIDRLINMGVFTWGAVQGISVTDPLAQSYIHLQDGLGMMFHLLAFLAIALYGLALVYRPLSREAGWAFVIAGLLALVLDQVFGFIPAFIYVGTGALGAAIWMLGVGFEESTA